MQDIPDTAALKAQASRLRAAMNAQGQSVSHAQALEVLARSYGFHDWNTLSARARGRNAPPEPEAPRWQIGQRVEGLYLGVPFRGRIHGAHLMGSQQVVVLDFDVAVNVSRSALMTILRKRVKATVDAAGMSPARTSDGQPQLILRPEAMRG
jgi:hypothetical protein